MKQELEELWDKIRAFELDDPGSSFTFTDRLARENGWSLEFALRAVFEYKRFLFLICATNTAKTPSDQIDQVWHLHLIYTQSYWKDLCKNTLNRDIHHGPTKGTEQKQTFKDFYAETLRDYEHFFEETAPEDIWPPERIRFGQINFTRINRYQNWVIPKFKRRNK